MASPPPSCADRNRRWPSASLTDQIRDLEASASRHERDLDALGERLADRGVDAEAVIAEVQRFSVAAPSWALGTGGTRFGRFPRGGEPRTTEEKLDDIAALHALTGANATVSLHVPWDDPDDPAALRAYADELGIGFDAMNSNTFQDNASTTGPGVSYKFGSLGALRSPTCASGRSSTTAPSSTSASQLGSTALTVWLADGTNHPGQANFRRQFERVADGLARAARRRSRPTGSCWSSTSRTSRRSTRPSTPTGASSLLLAQHAGERTRCLVDLGHHLPNANIEQVVSRLAMVGRLGGFHFNDSKYGDDDLTVGSIHPYQFFLIVCELVDHGDGAMPPCAT